MTRSVRPTRRIRRGLTLVELLIAIAITAIIGAAIGIVMTAAAQNLTRVSEVRSALQRSHAMRSRISAYTDAALCVLDEDEEQGFAVWLNDQNSGGTLNLSELRVIWYDGSGETISVEWVSWPEEWTPLEISAADNEVPIGTDYYTLIRAMRGAGMTESLTLADGIASCDLSHEAVSFVDADRIRAEVVFRVADDETQPMLFAIGIANHTVPN